MCKCVHKKCQFESFFGAYNDTKIYYVKDNGEFNKDEYCLFHAPESIKEKFSYYQNELLRKIIYEYIEFCSKGDKKQDIDFSNVVFTIPFEVYDTKVPLLNINFTETIFIEYFRMDNLHCKELIFKDTEFHDGGGIKNRGGTKKVNIEKLIFRPYQLESDFVIDIGKYANSEGLIESDKYGVIKNIRFENHKKGNGIIYFIGLNEYTKEANFRNMILDNVSFQNSDLSQCYFLNAKVDKTEFRDCSFPQGYIYKNYDVLRGKIQWAPWIVILAIIFISWVLIKNEGIGDKYLEFFINTINDYSIVVMIFSPLILFYLFYQIASLIKMIESKIANSNIENSNHGLHTLNPLKSIGRHFAIADEVDIYHKHYNTVIYDNNEKVRISNSLTALTASYIQLKNNFGRYDYQMAGSFFYAQRYYEVLTSRNKDQLIERWMLIAHHFVNGFGEKFMKPLLWFVLTVSIFALISWIGILPQASGEQVDKIIATEATPRFLLAENYTSKNIYKIQYIEQNDKNITRKYKADKLKSNFNTALIYSLSRFVSPLTAQTKSWFKVEGKVLTFFSFFETALLYLFFGAFILAIKNRIKR